MGIFEMASPMVSVKKSAMFSSVFLSKIGLEIMFSYSLERKEAFEDEKKSAKNRYFLKVLTHDLGQKPSGCAVCSGLLLFIL